MQFEITLRDQSKLDQHLSYCLVFIPSPVWIKNKKQLINLNPSSPKYQRGSVKKLIKKENLKFKESLKKEAVIVVNDVGHGTIKDLDNLKFDLKSENFNVIIYGLNESL